MIKLLITLFVTFKPVHVLQTEGRSCGANLAAQNYRLTLGDHAVKVNYTWWDLVTLEESDEELRDIAGVDPSNGSWGWALKFQKPNAYMSMEMLFNTSEAYLEIKGIDAKRRPCKDAFYLKRI